MGSQRYFCSSELLSNLTFQCDLYQVLAFFFVKYSQHHFVFASNHPNIFHMIIFLSIFSFSLSYHNKFIQTSIFSFQYVHDSYDDDDYINNHANRDTHHTHPCLRNLRNPRNLQNSQKTFTIQKYFFYFCDNFYISQTYSPLKLMF